MPEGDSIFWLAEKIRARACGETVRAASSIVFADEVTRSLVGRSVTSVASRGKNLVVRLDDARALHVHLRMVGRVRVVDRALTRPPRPPLPPLPPRAQLALGFDRATVAFARCPVLRLIRAAEETRSIGDLGPDLLADADRFDEDEAVRRLAHLRARSIGEAILVQRAIAGIGNEYKSEILFLEKIDPRRRVAALAPEALRRIVRRARALMTASVRAGRRVTRSTLGPSRWVYGRAGAPCAVCGETIARIYQGDAPRRSTYHCPRCQT